MTVGLTSGGASGLAASDSMAWSKYVLLLNWLNVACVIDESGPMLVEWLSTTSTGRLCHTNVAATELLSAARLSSASTRTSTQWEFGSANVYSNGRRSRDCPAASGGTSCWATCLPLTNSLAVWAGTSLPLRLATDAVMTAGRAVPISVGLTVRLATVRLAAS